MAPRARARATITKLAAAGAIALMAPVLAACADDSNAGRAAVVNIVNQAGGATESTAGAEAVVVDIVDFQFTPAEITIPAGTEVVWTNNDTDVHSIVSTDDLFPASDVFDAGESYSVIFPEPGTYSYICGVHPFMMGTVIVE